MNEKKENKDFEFSSLPFPSPLVLSYLNVHDFTMSRSFIDFFIEKQKQKTKEEGREMGEEDFDERELYSKINGGFQNWTRVVTSCTSKVTYQCQSFILGYSTCIFIE